MRTSDFDYDLPRDLIAQNPIAPRDRSRLMVLGRESGSLAHKHFYDLPELLRKGDVLVLNDTKVLPARLFGTIPEVGGRKVEVLLLNEPVGPLQRVLAKPARKLRMGREVEFDDRLRAEVMGVEEDGTRLLRFDCHPSELPRHLDRIGHAPLPPYIKESRASADQYQTIYARDPGSSAAPTAGLHFTGELFSRLESVGVQVEKLTLHVGRGTFQDVKADRLEDHTMHAEHFELPKAVADRLNRAKERGGRILAVGSTSVRVLETAAGRGGRLTPQVSRTELFIYPGYEWKFVDAMITNFHLPKSTLLMLVCSFAGKDPVFRAYAEAIRRQYRFFSFGDAMLIQ